MVILAIHVFMLHVCGQDFLINWWSVIDVFGAVASLMTQTQPVNLPTWKLPVWSSKIDDHLQKVIENLKSLASEDKQNNKINRLVFVVVLSRELIKFNWRKGFILRSWSFTRVARNKYWRRRKQRIIKEEKEQEIHMIAKFLVI